MNRAASFGLLGGSLTMAAAIALLIAHGVSESQALKQLAMRHGLHPATVAVAAKEGWTLHQTRAAEVLAKEAFPGRKPSSDLVVRAVTALDTVDFPSPGYEYKYPTHKETPFVPRDERGVDSLITKLKIPGLVSESLDPARASEKTNSRLRVWRALAKLRSSPDAGLRTGAAQLVLLRRHALRRGQTGPAFAAPESLHSGNRRVTFSRSERRPTGSTNGRPPFTMRR